MYKLARVSSRGREMIDNVKYIIIPNNMWWYELSPFHFHLPWPFYQYIFVSLRNLMQHQILPLSTIACCHTKWHLSRYLFMKKVYMYILSTLPGQHFLNPVFLWVVMVTYSINETVLIIEVLLFQRFIIIVTRLNFVILGYSRL